MTPTDSEEVRKMATSTVNTIVICIALIVLCIIGKMGKR